MRILADENMPDRTVELLRMAGHDVHFVKETMPSEADPNVLAVATGENRLLVTQDKDFGDIVVNRNQPAPMAWFCSGCIMIFQIPTGSG